MSTCDHLHVFCESTNILHCLSNRISYNVTNALPSTTIEDFCGDNKINLTNALTSIEKEQGY